MGAEPSQEREPESLVPAHRAGDVSDSLQFVTFISNGRNYGVDIMTVREIRSWSPMVELPQQPDGACGVLDMRGEVVQVYDLGRLLGGDATTAGEGHVVVVLALGGQTIGVLVDAVSDIIDIGKHQLRTPPPHRPDAESMVSCIAKHEDKILAILDLTPVVGPGRAEQAEMVDCQPQCGVWGRI